MKYIATFDIGTTAVKGVMLSTDGDPVFSKSIDISTIYDNDFKEQCPEDWYGAFCSITREYFAHGYQPKDVVGIIMSGQMQDLIPVDINGMPVGNAILYSDGRAENEAAYIKGLKGLEKLTECTGNSFDGSIPLAKLLWLRQNSYEQYRRTSKVLFSSKDYVILRLTGKHVTDVTTAATTGVMDIRKKAWVRQWMDAIDIDYEILPHLLYAEEQAGLVNEAAARETGYSPGTPVYAGTGDAGAATLASGITSDGEFNINLGTSGWVACVSSDILTKEGVFNLAAMPRGLYINVVPFFNAGNVHKWISKTLSKDTEQNEKYDYMGELLEQSTAGSHGVLFLPYLAGERFPIVDTRVRGGFVGITPETTKQDMARACLEGVAFSIRQGIESIGRTPQRLSLIGGGAQVKVWCQIFADVIGHQVSVFKNAEYLPAMAIAAAVMLSQGIISDYNDFTELLRKSSQCICYEPDPQAVLRMNQSYKAYLHLYPALKELSYSYTKAV